MRLTKFTDYGLRVLMYVAQAPEGRATIAQIAGAFRISQHHLVKVVHALGRHGFLRNSRGRRGGLRLARPADEINLGDVVRAMEAGDLPAECFYRETNTCLLAGGCGLQDALREAVAGFYDVLGKYSLAELRISPRRLQRLLVKKTPTTRSGVGIDPDQEHGEAVE
jgi:Rrf2 family transcriptional regulator, nitric oxide-sensitive transcriptional repressor